MRSSIHQCTTQPQPTTQPSANHHGATAVWKLCMHATTLTGAKGSDATDFPHGLQCGKTAVVQCLQMGSCSGNPYNNQQQQATTSTDVVWERMHSDVRACCCEPSHVYAHLRPPCYHALAPKRRAHCAPSSSGVLWKDGSKSWMTSESIYPRPMRCSDASSCCSKPSAL